jgi:acyl-CoA thioester hydrolase
MNDSQSCLDGFPIVIEIPILWGDEDAFGHVNNIMYLRWVEAARIEYLRRIDMFPPLPPTGVGPIVASVKCDYKTPLRSPDTVLSGARVTRIGNSSFIMEHRIVSRDRKVIAAEADTTMVIVDYSVGRPMRVPDETRRAIEELEGKSLTAEPAGAR